MLTMNTTAEQAEEIVVELARHVPWEVELGRPLTVMVEADGEAQIVTTSAARWWVEPGGTASRLVALDDDRAELTRWRAGVEVFRKIDRIG